MEKQTEALQKDIESAVKMIEKAVEKANKLLKKQGFAISAQADLHLLPKDKEQS